MQISSPDYSNLINASAANASVKNRIAAQKASEADAFGQSVMSLLKTTTDIATQVIKTQDEAQQAGLKDELEAKGQYYNQLLNESIKNGTTTIGKDENGELIVNYAPEVMEYRNTWLEDVNSREGLSSRTVEWANRIMDNVYNRSDEQVLYTIAANNASIASADMDETVRQAAITAASRGDSSILEQTIAGLQVSDQYKQAYTQWAMPIYESEYQTLHANELATTEGIDAAYKYINSLAVDSARKDTLKQSAYNEFTRSKTALLQSTDKSIETMLESGSSWGEIHKVLEGAEGYSAYERSLVREEITARQSTVVTNTCAPYLAQVQSGTLSVNELEDIKKDLKLNKGMFAGGLEGTYETYMGIVDNAIADRRQKDLSEGKTTDSQVLAQYKLQAENYYDMWNQGKISGAKALSQIRAIAEANPEDLNVVNAMNDFVNKIIDEKVPLIYRDYFTMKMNGFNSVYQLEASRLGYQPMNDDYVSNYETLYKDTANFIASHEDLTLEDIDTFMSDEMDGFFARYADAKAQEDAKATPAPVVYPTADLKNSAQYTYNAFNSGRLSAKQALANLDDLATASGGNAEALSDIEKYVAQINEQRVPDAWKTVYNDYTKNFDTLYIRQTGKKNLDALSDDEYVTYLNNKSYFEGALSDYIAENPGLTRSSINSEVQRIMKGMNSSYANKDITLKWGVDSAGTKSASFIDTLTEYSESVPFRYNYNSVTGNIEYEWINDKAQSNWDNAGRYGVQALKDLGYDVNSFEILELGGEALPIMLFRSADGQAMYTINLDAPITEADPKVGDVLKVDIESVGNIQFIKTSGTVTPAQSQVDAGQRAGTQAPAGAPRNYVFDETTMEGGATPGNANFQGQQAARQKAEEDAKKAEERAAEVAMNKAYVEGKAAGELTSTQNGIRTELEAIGYEYARAYELAPQVDAEMQRLRNEGVPQNELWETALKNLGLLPEEKPKPVKRNNNPIPEQRIRAW